VNDDGKLDLVYIGNDLVTVRLGRGDGTFGKAISSPCPGCFSPGGPILLMADLNNDGKPDVVTSVLLSGQLGSLGILIGNGDGTFQPAVAYGFGALNSVAAADFSHNGKLDLVATFYLSGAYIFTGNGDGTFGAPTLLNSEATFAMTADLNRDGNADIVINTINLDGLDIYLGHGDGTFSPPTSVDAQVLTPTLLVGDFNGDGVPDLLGGTEFNTIQTGFSEILLGDGMARFTVEKRQFPIGTTAIAAGDFNGDGKLDIAAAGPEDPFDPFSSSTVWIILNTTNH
jgi:hypothetical protein